VLKKEIKITHFFQTKILMLFQLSGATGGGSLTSATTGLRSLKTRAMMLARVGSNATGFEQTLLPV